MIKVEWFYWLMGLFFLVVGVLVTRDRSNPKRVTSGLFWGLLGLCFPYSSFVVAETAPAWLLGVAIVVGAALPGTGQRRRSGSAAAGTEDGALEGVDLDRDASGSGPGWTRRQQGGTGASGGGTSGGTSVATAPLRGREQRAEQFGNKLFIPVLAIPVITALCAVVGPHIVIDGKPLLQTGSETVIGLSAAGIIAIFIAMALFKLRTPALALTQGRRLTEDLGWALVLPQLLSVLGLVFATA